MKKEIKNLKSKIRLIRKIMWGIQYHTKKEYIGNMLLQLEIDYKRKIREIETNNRILKEVFKEAIQESKKNILIPPNPVELKKD